MCELVSCPLAALGVRLIVRFVSNFGGRRSWGTCNLPFDALGVQIDLVNTTSSVFPLAAFSLEHLGCHEMEHPSANYDMVFFTKQPRCMGSGRPQVAHRSGQLLWQNLYAHKTHESNP
eukprot:1742130-Amphidinium_carterae.1